MLTRTDMKKNGMMPIPKLCWLTNDPFVIQHELGTNWSMFAKELLFLIFMTLAEVSADISTTPKLN